MHACVILALQSFCAASSLHGYFPSLADGNSCASPVGRHGRRHPCPRKNGAAAEGAKRQELKGRAIEAVRQAASIVDAKAPIDAAAYKEWRPHISQKVAEASKEGCFLGFGGVAVSDAEKATLSEIRTALGRP